MAVSIRSQSILAVTLVLSFAFSSNVTSQEPAPTKEQLISTLKKTFDHLQKRDFEGASNYFVLPPDFRPDMLDGMIKRREISSEGIAHLERNAKFGTGEEVFGVERAKSLSDRQGQNVKKTFGFYHTAQDTTAEVLALWNGKQFKLMRLDDVGKLPSLTPTTKNKGAEPTKAALIDILKKAHAALEKGDYASASQYFVLPPEFKPEMLEPIVKRREISAAGIEVLAQSAEFGKVKDVFPKEQYDGDTVKGQDISKCYGFYHETKEATAQVIALWDGKQLKFVALDDVGKLVGANTASSEPATEKPSAVKPMTAEEKAAAEMERRTKLANAVATLSAHLEKNPDDVKVRARYAQALFGIGNTPESWKQLMIARKQDPNNGGIAKGMDMLINAFTKLGVFTVGVPTETVEGLLGEPTQKHESKTLRYVYGHWAIDFVDGRIHRLVDLRGLTNEHFAPLEIVDVDLDGAMRRCGFRRTTRSTVSAYFYKPGESIAKYTEQFAVERFPGGSVGSMKEIGQRYIGQEKKLIQGVMHKVLLADENTMTLAVKFPATNGDKSQDRHQLVRLLKGEKDLHRISFTIVSKDEPSQETQQLWFKLFQAAKLNKVADLKK